MCVVCLFVGSRVGVGVCAAAAAFAADSVDDDASVCMFFLPCFQF